MKFFARTVLITLAAASLLAAQSTPMPSLVKQDGRYALMVDGAPYLMLATQVNNSSAWPSQLPKVWPTVDALGVNTVEAPIYWEQFEPERGKFDTTVLHRLLDQAREHHVHLVLLWFGLWKNASGHYTPPFIKLDEKDVPHVVKADGGKVDSLAPYSQVGVEADRTAFVRLLQELKVADPQHTVLMVQVENEIGTYGSVRDFSAAAQKLFNTAVPQNILAVYKKQRGTWPQVFGDDADEFFYAWSIASDVQKIASAGKAENPLPLYMNVATRNPISGKRGSYPSGGPVDTVLPIWKATAPAIDAYGVDMYDRSYQVWQKLLDLYDRDDNPMFVPEVGNAPEYARFFYMALGHQTIGFSVFGMDKTGYVNFPLGAARIDDETLAPFELVFHTFAPMDRLIAKLNFEGKLQARAEDPDAHKQVLDFGKWRAVLSYGMPMFGGWDIKTPPGNKPADGGAMVAQLGPDEFLVTGTHVRVDFEPIDASGGKLQRQFVHVEEGSYANQGVDPQKDWRFERIWNGDQTDYGLNFTDQPQVLRVTLATY